MLEIHCYYTRSSNNYHLESVNTNVKQFSIKYKGPILWNSILPSIRSLKNINQFKQYIIRTLLEKYGYPQSCTFGIIISFCIIFTCAFEFSLTCLFVCFYFLFIIIIVVIEMFNFDSVTWVAHISGALSSLGTTSYT